MSNYLSLDEAAKKLGIGTDQLVELRSAGEVRGFRDGASWKFPENEIVRLKDQLPELLASGLDAMGGKPAGGGDSGLSIMDSDLDLSLEGSDPAEKVDLASELSLDPANDSDIGVGSDIRLADAENFGSDVNLVPSGDGSDVALVAGGSKIGDGGSSKSIDDDLSLSHNDLLSLDSAELKLSDPAILNESGPLKLSKEIEDEVDPVVAGSAMDLTSRSGVQAEDSLKIADDLPATGDDGSDLGIGTESGLGSDLSLGSAVDLAAGLSGIGSGIGSDVGVAAGNLDRGGDGGSDSLSLSSNDPDDSGEIVIGGADATDEGLDELASAAGGSSERTGPDGREASNLELMSDLSAPSEPEDAAAVGGGVDVLSELDLLSSAAGGSGLIGGDSGNLLASDGLGDLGPDALSESNLANLDDALDDDDDLVISADDDDLVISSAGSDVSVAGDSGINLMSPSDSGLSLESEPLDLAGSSISALDLGAELSDAGGSGSGSGIGSGIGGEDFQLTPSGIELEKDVPSASQVIEVEDSGDPVAEAEVMAAEPVLGGDADPFGAPAVAVIDDGVGDPMGQPVEAEAEAVAIDPTAPMAGRTVAAPVAYEVPFTLLQTLSLMLILFTFAIGGILMTDLVRNMWTYTEPAAPVSSLTDWLIESVGMGG